MSKREYQHQEARENGCEKIAIHYAKKCEDLEDEVKAKDERIIKLETAIRNIIACGKKPMWAGLHDACEKAEKLLKG